MTRAIGAKNDESRSRTRTRSQIQRNKKKCERAVQCRAEKKWHRSKRKPCPKRYSVNGALVYSRFRRRLAIFAWQSVYSGNL